MLHQQPGLRAPRVWHRVIANSQHRTGHRLTGREPRIRYYQAPCGQPGGGRPPFFRRHRASTSSLPRLKFEFGLPGSLLPGLVTALCCPVVLGADRDKAARLRAPTCRQAASVPLCAITLCGGVIDLEVGIARQAVVSCRQDFAAVTEHAIRIMRKLIEPLCG
jgi:hypothetical protein